MDTGNEKKINLAMGAAHQTDFVQDEVRAVSLSVQKFPTDPKANWSGQLGSFQLAKTRSRMAPH
jgi:hypothetical protein